MSGNDGARPLVSAILPTRNRAQLLSRAIDSILGQEGRGTQFDLDITVVDDASSDGTPEVMRRYPAVRYVRLETQRGAAAARNVGIKSSTGKYVAFQDDDDVWLPEKLRVQTGALERHPEVGVVYGQSLVRNEKGREFLWPDPSSAPSGFVFRPLLMTCFCAHPPGLLIRREVFAKAGYFDEQLLTNEDYDLWLRIAFHSPFLFVPGAVAVYHESPHGLYFSSMARGGAVDDARAVIRRALALLPDGPQYDALRREVQLRNELKIVIHKIWFAPREERWGAMLGAVRAYPEILRYRWGRWAIAMEALGQIVYSGAPIAVGRKVCTQLREAVGERGFKARLWLRLTLAAVWAEAAAALGHRPSKNGWAAAAAAAWAVLYDPLKFRKTTVLSALFRGLLWPLVGARHARRRPGEHHDVTVARP
jgi:glycosyltransferase involved in cell wall biosynthesis